MKTLLQVDLIYLIFIFFNRIRDHFYFKDVEQVNVEEVEERKLPLVISSSLDSTLRIWDIKKGSCLKELYLYNGIHHFQVDKTAFAVGLGLIEIHFQTILFKINFIISFKMLAKFNIGKI